MKLSKFVLYSITASTIMSIQTALPCASIARRVIWCFAKVYSREDKDGDVSTEQSLAISQSSRSRSSLWLLYGRVARFRCGVVHSNSRTCHA